MILDGLTAHNQYEDLSFSITDVSKFIKEAYAGLLNVLSPEDLDTIISLIKTFLS